MIRAWENKKQSTEYKKKIKIEDISIIKKTNKKWKNLRYKSDNKKLKMAYYNINHKLWLRVW